MTYQEYKENKQNELNNLPIFYAFSNEQLEKALNERGLTLDDIDKIYKLGDTGGFYLKKDSETIKAYFSRKAPLKELMETDYEFALSAFNYELDNHEYAINYYQGDWDVCSCFCNCEWSESKDYKDYLTEGGYSQKVIDAYSQASKEHYKRAENWF